MDTSASSNGPTALPPQILVVDDKEATREIISRMLASAGYASRQAGSGVEALALLSSGEEFSLMLTELMMAEIDGIDLLQRQG